MKISLDWLSDFITLTEQDPEAIARAVTAKVAEVDELETQGALLKNIAVGKILSIRKHPNADKLSLCEVRTDQGTKKVVCGGTNLREGMRIAFAHVGDRVRHGTELVTLERVKIRGEESDGMICAAEELDLAQKFPPKPEEGTRPVLDLGNGDDGVGKTLQEHFGFGDVILHIDNHAITHRPDLFSHHGFARELVALGLAKWKEEPQRKENAFPSTPLPFQCVVHGKKLMPRYCSCLLQIDSLGETPDWMKRRLEATGWRTINLAVDITNYVMMEIGVPLHSFDADDFRGDIHVRTAKKGEHITTLDGVDRELPSGAIVISDDEGIFDLLGIMGGLRSSTKDSTRRIYLHAASLDPSSIRKTVIATGHRTDAATVYEKGVSPVITREGFFRALELFLELAPGARIVSKLESMGDDGKAKPVTLKLKRLQSLLGMTIEPAKAAAILRDLGFTVEDKGTALKATPPLWRLGDIRGDHDLIEEIGRVLGYDSVEAVMPLGSLVPPPRDHRVHQMRDALKEEGFFEVLPLSLVSEALLKRANLFDAMPPLAIENPLGEELKYLQPSVLPGLFEHASQNLPLVEDSLSTFECAHVFEKNQGEWFECGMLIADRRETDLKHTPFLRLKAAIILALKQAGFHAVVQQASTTPPFGHPGRSSDILVNGTAVGFLTEVHPEVRARFDLPQRAAAATLDLTTLLSLPSRTAIAKSVPQFPAVTYDVTVMRTQREQTGELLKKLRAASTLLESVDIVDLYDGKPLEPGRFNLTLRFTYRAPDRTLTEEEAKKEQEKVAKLLG